MRYVCIRLILKAPKVSLLRPSYTRRVLCAWTCSPAPLRHEDRSRRVRATLLFARCAVSTLITARNTREVMHPYTCGCVFLCHISPLLFLAENEEERYWANIYLHRQAPTFRRFPESVGDTGLSRSQGQAATPLNACCFCFPFRRTVALELCCSDCMRRYIAAEKELARST